ncbi:hypothetical protein D3C72_2125270 [compost metagenome]
MVSLPQMMAVGGFRELISVRRASCPSIRFKVRSIRRSCGKASPRLPNASRTPAIRPAERSLIPDGCAMMPKSLWPRSSK